MLEKASTVPPDNVRVHPLEFVRKLPRYVANIFLELAQICLDIFGIFGSTVRNGIFYKYETHNSK